MAWLNFYLLRKIMLVKLFIFHLIVRFVVIMMFFVVVVFLLWWICWLWMVFGLGVVVFLLWWICWLWMVDGLVVGGLWMVGRRWVVWVMLLLSWESRPIKIRGKSERIILSCWFWNILIVISITTWRDSKAREAADRDNMLVRIFLVVSMMVFFWWVAWLMVMFWLRVIYWLRFWMISWFWFVHRFWFWMVYWDSWLMIALNWWISLLMVVSTRSRESIKLSLKKCKVIMFWFFFRLWFQRSSLNRYQHCSCEELASHYKK